MSGHVLLNVLNQLGKGDISFSRQVEEIQQYKSTNVRFDLSYDIKITLKSHFCRKNVIMLSLCTQRCYGRHNISRKSVNN